MPEMSRRDWLTGVVTSVVGAQLVIAANARAEGIVLPNKEVKIYNPDDMRAAIDPGPGSLVFMMAEDGSYKPIGFLTEMHAAVDTPITGEFESTSMIDKVTRSGYPGTLRIEGRFISTGLTEVPINFNWPNDRATRVKRIR